MLFDTHVNVNFSDMLDDISIPEMIRIRQLFKKERIDDVAGETRKQMERFRCLELSGKRIAVTAGSRGIRDSGVILKRILDSLKEFGAKPFIVAAMGSHAGATSHGQLDMLRNLGIDEERMGVPVACSMETRQIGSLRDGTPVYLSSDALDADGILVVNKIKPHADFKAEHESGLVKMMAIGLGKHKGCASLHRLGFASFGKTLPETAEIIMRQANIIGGLAIVENAADEVMHLESILPPQILTREKELLKMAKDNVARILTPEIDVLIIDEIGKHISGEGMDPNVTGRPGSYLNDGFGFVSIGSIFIRDIADSSAGNGAGIGMADLTTVRCVQKLDPGAMYTNSITAGILGPARLPVVLNNDREAILTAIKISAANRLNAPRIAYIRNTLLLEELLVSRSLADEMCKREDVEMIGAQTLEFDEQGYLTTKV